MKETRIFKQTDTCTLSADVYYQGVNSPVIIYIHGGALIFGSRTWMPVEQIEFFTRHGFSLVNVDYRLAPETEFHQIIEDVKDAIHWVKTKAIEWYEFDIDNIAVMGSSAGGYLSLLSGTMEITPKAIVSLYGYGHILGDWLSRPSTFYCKRPQIDRIKALKSLDNKEVTNGDWKRFEFYLYCRQHGVWIEEVTKLDRNLERNKLVEYNPIDHVTKEFPPTLFLHGNQDNDVPYEQSVMMYEQLMKQGVSTKLITVEGADHVFDQNFNDPRVQDAYQSIIDFLRDHL